MKPLILAFSALMMLTSPGWGQNSAHDQAKAGAAGPREEAHSHPERRHHRRKHRRHHRRHNGA